MSLTIEDAPEESDSDDELCDDERSGIIEDAPEESSENSEHEPVFFAEFHQDVLLLASMQDLIKKNTQHYTDLYELLQNVQYNILLVLPILAALCGFYVGRNW